MSDGRWVSLFSGGKDSSWALYRALESGLDVVRLVTVHPEGDSYMYHTPATHLASLAAESIGVPLLDVHPGDLDAASATDSAAQGDAELEPLEAALRSLDAEIGVDGVIAGAVESAYQTDRISAMADRIGAETFTPLWRRNPAMLATEMIASGFEIVIVQVAAYGLDESWLGRTLDRDALAELVALNEEYGVHVLGEGGEFETFVVDGPHMDYRITLDHHATWNGDRGHLTITDATLE